jgi:hypothetical protein
VSNPNPKPQNRKPNTLPKEMIMHICEYLNAEKDFINAQRVCQDWKKAATDPVLISPLKKIIQQNIENLRPFLGHCTQCSEGRIGGFGVGLWIDEQGNFHALFGHDVNGKWLIENKNSSNDSIDEVSTPPKGLYNISFRMRTFDWNKGKNEAFYILSFDSSEKNLPKNIQNIQNKILNELNQLASGAWNIAEKESIKLSFIGQPWFQVMQNPMYTRSQLILAS